MSERPSARSMRDPLFGLLPVGMLGLGAELVLLEHYEDTWQLVPLLALGAGLCAVIWQAAAASRASLLALRSAMGLFLAASAAGLWLHFKGNVEFEREMYPTLKGMPLVWKSLKGATPALAPGMMGFLGLFGLVWSFLYPYCTATPQPPCTD